MRRFRVTIIATSILLVAVAPQAGAQSAAPGVKLYRPFSAKMKVTYVDDEDRGTQFLRSFSRRSDGSYARINETGGYDGERGTVQYIADTVNRSWTSGNSFTKSATTLPLLDEGEFRDFLELPGSCTSLADGTWKRLGESERLGVHVIEVEQKISKNLSFRLWVAPELECFALLNLYIVKGVVRSKTEVLSFETGDPDPSAFRVPPGYVEVSPLEFDELWKKRSNGRSFYGDDQVQILERKYQSGKARLKDLGPVK